MSEIRFSFEDLEVWQKAVDFAVSVIYIAEIINTNQNHYRLIEQLESSVTSISANIAEGKGRNSKKEFIQYLYVARGSLFETITFLTIFYKKKWISSSNLNDLRIAGDTIGKQLSSLINSIKKTI
ncbi:four helix bundle protein [uncultured Candidatus Kuenenia sp.]|uniref:four helix bundle protein n=1 Tax=uncultured Candidatus Kuenenia sp. TaxID=1048336 RepID=UPI0025DC783C|nr:four helix bundle protein [uncultured Candidatus Kuenenia sp.]